MIKVGITGLIASGKSTVAKTLSRGKHPVFNADFEVKKIYKKRVFKEKFTNNLKLKQKDL